MRTKRAKELKRFVSFLKKWNPDRTEITHKHIKKAYNENKPILLRDLKKWNHTLKNQPLR